MPPDLQPAPSKLPVPPVTGVHNNHPCGQQAGGGGFVGRRGSRADQKGNGPGMNRESPSSHLRMKNPHLKGHSYLDTHLEAQTYKPLTPASAPT